MTGETLLLGVDAFRFLEDRGLPVLRTVMARDADEAAHAAAAAGFPVALKIASPDVIHKTETGGIRTSLRDEAEVRDAFASITGAFKAKNPEKRLDGVLVQSQGEGIELIVGTLTDAQFGPVIMCGIGGVFVEALDDVAFRLIPIEPKDATQMVEDLQGFRLLARPRSHSIDLAQVHAFLVAVSRLVEEHPEVREMDLNPVFVSSSGLKVCDARIKIG
jgi:acyl-CoA synthetase (NDP forming)